jgi:hypothetical protein
VVLNGWFDLCVLGFVGFFFDAVGDIDEWWNYHLRRVGFKGVEEHLFSTFETEDA